MVIFMEYRKNDIVTLKIEDCGIDGEGIGKADGFRLTALDCFVCWRQRCLVWSF